MTVRRVPWPALAAFGVALAGTGCAPIVTHGPRVEPGLTVYATGGAPQRLCDSTVCTTELIPQLGAGLRYGRPATETAAGWSVGLTASSSVISSDVDVYGQLPRGTGGVEAGGGILLGGAYTMPYVQAGRLGPDGSGFYTTQGLAWMYPRPPEIRFDTYSGVETVEPLYWAPTVAYRHARRGRVIHVYLAGAFGRARVHDPVPDSTGRIRGSQPVRTVMLGVTAERRVRGVMPPVLPPPRSGLSSPSPATAVPSPGSSIP